MIVDIEDYVDANGRLIDQQPAYNKMLNAEVVLQLDEKFASGRLKQKF